MTLDPKRIAELKALATRDAEVRADPGRFRWTVQTEWQAQYSAAAREAVPALIAEVERLAEVERCAKTVAAALESETVRVGTLVAVEQMVAAIEGRDAVDPDDLGPG